MCWYGGTGMMGWGFGLMTLQLLLVVGLVLAVAALLLRDGGTRRR